MLFCIVRANAVRTGVLRKKPLYREAFPALSPGVTGYNTVIKGLKTVKSNRFIIIGLLAIVAGCATNQSQFFNADVVREVAQEQDMGEFVFETPMGTEVVMEYAHAPIGSGTTAQTLAFTCEGVIEGAVIVPTSKFMRLAIQNVDQGRELCPNEARGLRLNVTADTSEISWNCRDMSKRYTLLLRFQRPSAGILEMFTSFVSQPTVEARTHFTFRDGHLVELGDEDEVEDSEIRRPRRRGREQNFDDEPTTRDDRDDNRPRRTGGLGVRRRRRPEPEVPTTRRDLRDEEVEEESLAAAPALTLE